VPNGIPSRKLLTAAASLSWLMTIRARLCMAFGFATAITVVGSLIALCELMVIGGTVTEIVSDIVPATAHSLRLAEEASGLIASVPADRPGHPDCPFARAALCAQRA
jgi:hypothetical protein